MSINKDNATIRYYRGLIRDLDAQLKDALARIKNLERKIKKIPLSSPSSPGDMQIFSADDINRGVLPEGSTASSGGGFTEDEIKAMIIAWINDGTLPIQMHDHTDDNKGGDSYSNKGAALQ